MRRKNALTLRLILVLNLLTLCALTAGPLFPDGLQKTQWTQFDAKGYSKPVTGIIFRGEPQPVTGAPLGVLDTGFIDVSANGTLGFTSIFNDLAPRGGPLDLPFVGMSVGGITWLLASDQSAEVEDTVAVPILPGAGGVFEVASSYQIPGAVLPLEDNDWMQMGEARTNRKDGLAAVVKARAPKFNLQAGDVGGCTETTPAGTPNDQVTWIAWKAPSSMKVTVKGGVWSNHEGRECAFVVRKNGRVIHGGISGDNTPELLINKNATSADPEKFQLTDIQVAANDTLSFSFHSKGDPTYPNFGTIFGISAKIVGPGQTWDLTQDFDLTKGNPNGPWSYGNGQIEAPKESPLAKIAGVRKASSIDLGALSHHRYAVCDRRPGRGRHACPGSFYSARHQGDEHAGSRFRDPFEEQNRRGTERRAGL